MPCIFFHSFQRLIPPGQNEDTFDYEIFLFSWRYPLCRHAPFSTSRRSFSHAHYPSNTLLGSSIRIQRYSLILQMVFIRDFSLFYPSTPFVISPIYKLKISLSNHKLLHCFLFNTPLRRNTLSY